MTDATWEFSTSVIDKARHYLQHGRVRRDPKVAGIYWVAGSDPTRRYRVQTDANPETRTASWITCTCPHGMNVGAGAAKCSHAVAVLLAVRDGITLETTKQVFDKD